MGEETTCPLGKPFEENSATWTCYFCHYPRDRIRIHEGDDPCPCSGYRRDVSNYATVCAEHLQALDVLMADTLLGKLHRHLVRKADMAGRPCDD